ncbi:hypothetical protein [Sphingomonas sp.]
MFEERGEFGEGGRVELSVLTMRREDAGAAVLADGDFEASFEKRSLP